MHTGYGLALAFKNSVVIVVAALGLSILDQLGAWGPLIGFGLVYTAFLISVGYRINP